MTDKHIRIISEHRSAQDNEFFFYHEPKQIGGLRELIEFLERKHGFVFEEIPHWQIKTIVKGDHFTRTHGLRVKC